jgi:hypothetical protein
VRLMVIYPIFNNLKEWGYTSFVHLLLLPHFLSMAICFITFKNK